jgi:competence protein ComEC
MSRRFEQLETWWGREATRHFLWLPACFGAGIALYYALTFEPPVTLLPLLAVAVSGMFFFVRRRLSPFARAAVLGLLIVLMGAAYASIRAQGGQPTLLTESLSPRPVVGVVRDIERTEHGVRLTLTKPVVDGLATERTPTQLRLSIRPAKASSERILSQAPLQ